MRRSARVRGIEPNVSAEPAGGLPIRSSGIEAVVGTEEKEAVEGGKGKKMSSPGIEPAPGMMCSQLPHRWPHLRRVSLAERRT